MVADNLDSTVKPLIAAEESATDSSVQSSEVTAWI